VRTTFLSLPIGKLLFPSLKIPVAMSLPKAWPIGCLPPRYPCLFTSHHFRSPDVLLCLFFLFPPSPVPGAGPQFYEYLPGLLPFSTSDLSLFPVPFLFSFSVCSVPRKVGPFLAVALPVTGSKIHSRRGLSFPADAYAVTLFSPFQRNWGRFTPLLLRVAAMSPSYFGFFPDPSGTDSGIQRSEGPASRFYERSPP